MRLRITPLYFVLVLVPFFSACKKSEPNYEKIIYPNGDEEVVKKSTINSLTPDGKEVSILPPEWISFYNHSDDLSNIESYYSPGQENCSPLSYTVRWTNDNPSTNYQFLISNNKQMNDPLIFDTEGAYYELKDLYAGTDYYYQIKALYEDKTILSKRFYFKTTDYMRTIKIDGVFNTRDLGNKKTNDGKKKVKQGLVYRTANFDSVTSKGVTQAIEQYGIKTDLDLREKGLMEESPLGSQVKYINNGVGDYGSPYYVSVDTGVNVPLYQEAMRDNLKVFANINNYPLAFHCAVGRDRTGTLAITLLLLLGIKQEQIKHDYVVSFFSKACNSESVDGYLASMNYLFMYYEKYKGDETKDKDDVYKRVESYCLHIGVTKEEINSIRSILLENA